MRVLSTTTKWQQMLLSVALLAIQYVRCGALYSCPNQCSSQGSCNQLYGTCSCYSGFTGSDCSQRKCAEGTPWFDVANSTDSAHIGAVECSNVGTCDRTTGICDCGILFEGASCDLLRCPSNDGDICSGRGTCLTMAEFAEAFDGNTSFVNTEYSLWDGSMIQGCVCDPPYFGFDCSLTACETGDDPGSILSDQECNARGTCDYTTGTCSCEDGYSSSSSEGANCAVKDNATLTATCPVSPATHRRSHGGTVMTGACSGRGFCDISDNDKSKYCQCHDGWTGYVCDERTCPTGRAWFDEATSLDTAHATAECSAMGTCDRNTGRCSCRRGFEGAACERMQCPSSNQEPCGGRGRCVTMREAATEAINTLGDPEPITYGSVPGFEGMAAWDADKIQGCSCFGSAFEYRFADAHGPRKSRTGPNCMEWACASGDPVYNLGASTPEVQQVDCESGSDAGDTTFTLTFRGKTTESIVGDASSDTIQNALEDLLTVGSVAVSFVDNAIEPCAVGGSAFQVTFLSEFGDLPELTAACSGDCVSVSTSVDTVGTKLNTVCSGNGICDSSTGDCKCFDGYASSNGFGVSGLRLDCGFNLEVS